MTLIKSISGIRGTIGGKVGESLTPLDIVRFTSSYALWIYNNPKSNSDLVVIGRDSRVSGLMISNIVSSTLMASGLNVLDLGLSTTPTVEMAVQLEKASGGIVITASHNPGNWNALKLLNHDGEFISEADGKKILEFSYEKYFHYKQVKDLGVYKKQENYHLIHIDKILNLPLVDIESIKDSKFKIVVDAVNSTGGIAVPALLDRLGVECIELYCNPNGLFPHNPEPLEENLSDISNKVQQTGADLGIVVDPDVDRLALVCEDGSMFGEEYTLVAVADYVLCEKLGNTVSNLSSTRALKDITEKHGAMYNSSSVGEVNVVEKMKLTNAIIGGEGNGGVIYPELHYGRDALVGIALFLSHLSKKEKKMTQLRDSYPKYYMEKRKIELKKETCLDEIFKELKRQYRNEKLDTNDGIKIDYKNEWVHLRKSNTEPIIRIYTESISSDRAKSLADNIIRAISKILES